MTHQQHTPFIINLSKTEDGYTFHSLEEHTQPQPKSKKAKAPPSKTNHSKTSARLFKEIGISEIPPLIQEESHDQKNQLKEGQDVARQEFDLAPQEEEVEIEIKRGLELPNSPCEWFEYDSIHPIEADLFPEFHTGKSYKTPELYLCYRNFMIDAYRKNPNRYLTFISCRRVLRGDASYLLKIYNFLVSQGIINYCIYNQGNYTFQTQAVDRVSDLTKRPQSCVKKIPEQPPTKREEELDTDNLTVTVINKNFSRTFRVYCSACRLICGIVWYSNQDNQRNLCFECYNNSEYEAVRSYIKVDILKKMQSSKDSKQTSKTSWGLDDNIKLLDFMGNCEGRSWNDLLSQFQGKKALEDIIIQFMQFPITNYDPQAESQKLKHKQIDYTQQQHINMLYKLYEKSPVAQELKFEDKNGEETEEYRGSQAPRFHAYSNLLLRKYINKMESLKKIDLAIEESNINILEQPLCKRLRISQTIGKEQSDDLNNESEDQ